MSGSGVTQNKSKQSLPDSPGIFSFAGNFFFFQKWRRPRFIEYAVNSD